MGRTKTMGRFFIRFHTLLSFSVHGCHNLLVLFLMQVSGEVHLGGCNVGELARQTGYGGCLVGRMSL
jgi:hypothetical protein